jgi:diguanylate cyclase (GGDEF)-like protein
MDPSKQPRIFVADHPVDGRAWATVAMHGLGSVVQWEDGQKLLDALLEVPVPDVVFVSDDLPDFTGLELCRRLTESPAMRATPVILMATDTNDDYIRCAFEAGAADVLQKPLHPDLLRARVRSYFALGRQTRTLDVDTQTRTADLERVIETLRAELSDRERLMARAEFLFDHDLVTGLPNRRHLLQLVERARRRAEGSKWPMAIIALGIEHYATLQSSMDKDSFDRLLSAAAAGLRQSLRPMDFVARISEDLFAAVVVPRETDTLEMVSRNAREIVARAAAALNSEIVLDGRHVALEVRTAVAIYPQDGAHGKDLLKHLDDTLTLTRGATPRERRRIKTPDLASALALELRLRQAIDSDRLIPFYQPKIDAKTGRLLGGETLIRWPLRTGEYVGPGEFVPIAEAGGLIPVLDDYVLTAACVQIAEWQDRFPDFRIGVNLSALKLHNRGVFDRLRELFATTGARARHLELEITESALITDFDAASNWLSAVRTMGVSVALDDFGTGYSSLAYLRRLPLDAIKIDQSFVSGLNEDRSTVPIVRAMIAMAKALGMQVIAEGVETSWQAQILTELGCDGLQGFLYSPAVPADNFEVMLAAGRVDPRVETRKPEPLADRRRASESAKPPESRRQGSDAPAAARDRPQNAQSKRKP